MGEDRIILGIDPGTTVLGYGLVQVVQGKISLVNFGVVQLHKLTN
ncbi:MAG: crossover junction endodeoxyribonuclease RuvC, partial [Flavobacteriia bacterium]|nr:crossover junction endodeoxyribonuclease RuvC [Flavobacteriia bacterium]